MTLGNLMQRFPGVGRVEWLGIRPARQAPLVCAGEVKAQTGLGLVGDHYRSAGGKRQVTLIQWEHLAVIGAFLAEPPISPTRLRRNIVVSGINLLAVADRLCRVGGALLEISGPCEPCSRMERELGYGGFNAMRGHGGVTARVLESGVIRLGDGVCVIAAATSSDA